MWTRLTEQEALERARRHLPEGVREADPASAHRGWWSWTFQFEGDQPGTDPNWIIVHVSRLTGRVSFTPTE